MEHPYIFCVPTDGGTGILRMVFRLNWGENDRLLAAEHRLNLVYLWDGGIGKSLVVGLKRFGRLFLFSFRRA